MDIQQHPIKQPEDTFEVKKNCGSCLSKDSSDNSRAKQEKMREGTGVIKTKVCKRIPPQVFFGWAKDLYLEIFHRYIIF